MIRWRSLLIRLSLVIAVVIAARFALEPLAKRSAKNLIWAGTNAQVEIGKSTVGLFPPRVRFEDVTVVPIDSEKQGVGSTEFGKDGQASSWRLDSVDFSIDAEALLHRRFVVRSGQMQGLKITANPQPFTPLSAEGGISTDESSAACFEEFVSQLSSVSKLSVDSVANQLELTKRADQIRRRWKSEYSTLRKRAEELEASLTSAAEATQGLSNPLRDRERVDMALAKSKSVQSELASVRKAIDELPGQIQRDFESLQQAKQADQAHLANTLIANSPHIEPQGASLVAYGVNRQIDRLREYVQLCRNLTSHPSSAAPADQRGETIDLDRGQAGSQWWIGRCELSGELLSGSQTYRLSGLVENLSNDAGLCTGPFRARMKLDGEQTVRVDYSRDDSSGPCKDQLTLHWPAADASSLTLGNPGSMALLVNGGSVEVWAQLEMRGDELTGRLISRRTGAQLDVQSQHATASTFVQPLRQTLAALNQVEIDATFIGEWDAMNCEIVTNLTPLLKSGMDRALVAQTESVRLILADKLDELYQRELRELQAGINAEQTQTRDLIARADAKAQGISDSLTGDASKADAYLGRLRSGSLR